MQFPLRKGGQGWIWIFRGSLITGADFLPSDNENPARKGARRKVPGIKYGVSGIARNCVFMNRSTSTDLEHVRASRQLHPKDIVVHSNQAVWPVGVVERLAFYSVQ